MATIRKRRLVSGEIVWELTHGSGRDRKRFTVGKTREQAQEALNQFNRQLALHGEAPAEGSVESILGQYLQYLKNNRRKSTCRRYGRVLKTFVDNFLRPYHPEVQRLRQVTPAHIETYKNRRLAGTLSEIEDPTVDQRETELRALSGGRAPTRQTNAKFGWLGRKRFKPAITPRTVNYELQAIRTFFQWAVRRNYLFVNPTSPIERLRIPKRTLPKFLTSDQLQRLFA